MRPRLGGLPAGAWLCAAPAAAGTLGTAVTFEQGDVTISCRVVNLGRKPVAIREVVILANDPGAGIPGFETCTNAPLPPDGVCVISGATPSGHIGARIEVQGSGKTLRGVCSVSGSDDTPQPLEMR